MAVRRVKKQESPARTLRGRETHVETKRQPVDRRLALARLSYVLLSVGLLVALYQLLGSPALRVTRVDVTGNYLLSREAIAQAAGVLNTNVFSVDKREAAEAVRSLGILRSVEITTILPNTVAITVVENEPRFVWETNDQVYLIDGSGVVLANAAENVALPGLREVDGKALRRGDKVDLAALEAVTHLKAVWRESLGSAFTCEYSSDGLTVVGDGWRADLGEGTEIDAKVLALTAINDSLVDSEDELAFVNLRNAERPYFTLKQ